MYHKNEKYILHRRANNIIIKYKLKIYVKNFKI